jgi:cyclopropane-fatty-acyl-phospholipid synthase
VRGTERRLENFAQLLGHARERLGLDLGFVLWDGSTVPAGLPDDAFAIMIADEGAVAALIRGPSLETILNLWVSARLDLRNGTLFDLVARRPKVRTKDFLRALEKRLAFGAAAKFLFVPRGGPWPLQRQPKIPVADGSESANRENVQYHYDLSNRFYALFLDPDMVYSCGYFADWADDLATAQRNKLDMSCRRLRLKPGETLLDIGCGWGALICHAAQHYGVRAHGLTLSQKQYDLAKEKIVGLDLQDRVTLELRDYAQIDGSFDKIASIGMFEHVGIDNHLAYFQTVNRLLKPDGLYLHHAITRPAKRDDKAFRKRRSEYAVTIFSIHFLQRSLVGWGWDWRSADRSSKLIKAGCGRPPVLNMDQFFGSLCRRVISKHRFRLAVDSNFAAEAFICGPLPVLADCVAKVGGTSSDRPKRAILESEGVNF